MSVLNWFGIVWFSFLILSVEMLNGLKWSHDEAVGGFFDGPAEGAGNTSFEG